MQSGIPHGGRGKGPRLHDLRYTFSQYLQVEEPTLLLQSQRILAMPLRRYIRNEVAYLPKDHLAALLAQPDIKRSFGRR